MCDSESKDIPEPDPGKFLNPEEYYQRFIKEAPYVPGDNGEPCDSSQIPWLNPKLVREGQDFIKRNFFSLFLAHIGALLYGFSFKTLTSVLLRTGGFGLGDSTKSMLRHVETEIHINKWYDTDILSNASAGFKDIQIVRKLHMIALRRSQRTPLNLVSDVPRKEEKLQLIEAIRKDLDICCDTSNAPKHVLTYHPELFFSQFDMAMTQFGFFSVIFLFPDSLGVWDKRGLDGFVHLWAVYGRMLGIEDRFNVALYPHRELHLKLLYNLALPSLKDLDLTILHLQQTYMDALSRILWFTSLKSSLLFGFENMKQIVPNWEGEHLHALMDWHDRLLCVLMKCVIFLVYYVDFLRHFVNFSLLLFVKINQRRVLAKSQAARKPGTATVKMDGIGALPSMIVHQRA